MIFAALGAAFLTGIGVGWVACYDYHLYEGDFNDERLRVNGHVVVNDLDHYKCAECGMETMDPDGMEAIECAEMEATPVTN